MNVVYGRREIFWNKEYKELCIISIQEVRDRRSTDERAKRSSINIEKNRAENGALGNLKERGDEGEMCGGIGTTDVRDERYEVNHCSETEEMPNQVQRR